jgi:hypothetical protein
VNEVDRTDGPVQAEAKGNEHSLHCIQVLGTGECHLIRKRGQEELGHASHRYKFKDEIPCC